MVSSSDAVYHSKTMVNIALYVEYLQSHHKSCNSIVPKRHIGGLLVL